MSIRSKLFRRPSLKVYLFSIRMILEKRKFKRSKLWHIRWTQSWTNEVNKVFSTKSFGSAKCPSKSDVRDRHDAEMHWFFDSKFENNLPSASLNFFLTVSSFFKHQNWLFLINWNQPSLHLSAGWFGAPLKLMLISFIFKRVPESLVMRIVSTPVAWSKLNSNLLALTDPI